MEPLNEARRSWQQFHKDQGDAQALLDTANDHFSRAVPIGSLITFRKGSMLRSARATVEGHSLGYWTNHFGLQVTNLTTGKIRWISYSDVEEILEVPNAK